MSVLVILLASVPSPVPPPVEQMQANCQSPTYATDKLVCAEPDLKSIDTEMGALASQVGGVAVGGLAPWLESQAEWFTRRSLCAFQEDHRQCAIDAYSERLTVLYAVERFADMKAPRYACRSARGTHNYNAQFVSERAVGLIDGDRIVGVALQSDRQSTWRPFLTFKVIGRKLILSGTTAGKLVCRQS